MACSSTPPWSSAEHASMQPGIYGTSPGGSGRLSDSKHHQQSSSSTSQARKLLKRIQYDAALDEKEWTVGVLETREQAERKSGAEAWSLRVQSTVVEHSFAEFVAKFDREGEEVPFHRISWFKQNGVLVWEAEHSRHHNHGPPHHSSSCGGGGGLSMSVSPGLGGSCMLGCSPPAGSFMARLAAAGPPPGSLTAAGSGGAVHVVVGSAGSSFSGLPPRCFNNSSPLEVGSLPSGGAAQHSAPVQQHGWRPHRLSGTDLGGSSSGGVGGGGSSSWSGAAGVRDASSASPWLGPVGCAHVGFASSCQHTATPSPLLGSSPSSSTGGGVAGQPASSTAAHHKGLGGPECSSLSYISSSSPAGSCSSSWAGTSPLAAAAAALAAGTSPSAAAAVGPLRTALPAGGLAAAMLAAGAGAAGAGGVDGVQDAGVDCVQQQQQPELADYSHLPEKCWMDVLQRLGVRELCCAARVNTALRGLTARPCVWSGAYQRLFGKPPPADWSGPTVKRLCRRSELKASRWLEADVEARTVGCAGTWCCQLDESKVVSGDGCAVRLWAHESGRRIATLRGHPGRVTSVAFDDEYILSGCSQSAVKLWSMDELKLSKTLRHHTGPVSATLLLHGLPISGGKDGSVCLWDTNAPNSPMVVLEAGGPVHALQLLQERGYLLTGSNSLGVWDMETTQLLFTLDAPLVSSAAGSGLSASSSAASLAAASGAATAAAAAPAADRDVVEEDEDEDLLQNGWLLQDDEDDDSSDSGLSDDDAEQQQHSHAQHQQQPAAAPAGGQAGSRSRGSRGTTIKPWTSISCHGNLVAAGNASGVVLWDVRTQEAVGSLPAFRAGGNSSRASSSSQTCVGVQLDDWRLVTGFTAAGSSSSGGGGGGGISSSGGGGGGNACWWHSSGEAWADEGFGSGRGAGGHSLEVYDIRAASSYSSAAADTGGAAALGSSSGSAKPSGLGLWTAAPVVSLPVPNRITCFQFHGQHLLVGQEGAECCLLSFRPPGSRSGHAAAAWGYGGGAASSSRGSCGYAAAGIIGGASPAGPYMASPGGAAAGFGGDEGGAGGGGSSSSGKKGKKGGGTKVPAKKQTRYPKRATR